MQSRVLISGASGLIGSSVVRALRANSIHPTKLVRRPVEPGEQALRWNPESQQESLPGLNHLDGAIHLSGANVAAQRWTEAYKKVILKSRIESTGTLCRLLAKMDSPPQVLVCASAIGFYGDRGDEAVDEDSAPGVGFLPEVCKAWEAATRPAEEAGIRIAHLRFGVVLSPAGGALQKLRPLFRLGLGGRLGNGRQWMSWISLRDTVSAILRALEDPALAGAVNVTAPNPVTNAEFTQTLGKALHRPALLAVPAFALRLAVGEMADEGLLASCRAVPAKLLSAGFFFEDPDLEPALRGMLR